MRTVAVALLLVLAACGGDSDAPTPPKTTATKAVVKPTPKVTVKPTVASPTGKPAPEALSRFRCEKDAKGVWNAVGYLANPGKAKVTFQVTVYIGAATGGEGKAKTQQVANVAAGGSVKFVIGNIPAPKGGGPCYVQVLEKD